MVYDEPRGLRDYDRAKLSWIDDVQKVGREKLGRIRPARALGGLDRAGQGLRPRGHPLHLGHHRAAEGRHVELRQHASSRRATAIVFDKLDENEETIAYLPLAWVGDHLFSYAQHYVAGYCVNCPEAGETVVEDRREIGTTYAFAPPRVYENLLTLTMVRMEDAGRAQAQDVPLLHRSCAQVGREDPQRRAGAARRRG